MGNRQVRERAGSYGVLGDFFKSKRKSDEDFDIKDREGEKSTIYQSTKRITKITGKKRVEGK